MLAKNAAEVITCVHKGHQQKIRQFYSTWVCNHMKDIFINQHTYAKVNHPINKFSRL